MMTKLAIRNVKQRSIFDPCPIRVARKKDELRIAIDKILDQPGAGYTVDWGSTFLSAARSLRGGAPKARRYSRLNCDGLS